MGNQIHYHIVKDEYAARVSNLHMYNAVRLVFFQLSSTFSPGLPPLCFLENLSLSFHSYA